MLKFLEFITENASEEPISIQIEKLFYGLDVEKQREVQDILGKYLVLDKKRYKVYSTNDIVLVEYWYNHMLTPVKILEKKGHSYEISHNIDDSKIKNAPDEIVKNYTIIDYYYKQTKDDNKFAISPDVRLKNSIEALHPYIQNKLFQEIKNTINESNIDTTTSLTYGKSVFTTFLKILSALNLSSNLKKLTDDCPKDFIYYYELKNIDIENLKNVIKRYKSVSNLDIADCIGLYFGVNFKDGRIYMSYGIVRDGESRQYIGEFILSNKELTNIVNTNNKYLTTFKSDMESILHNTKHMRRLAKLKNDISTLSPAFYKKKTHPYINENTLVIKFYGLGIWTEGMMKEENLKDIKNAFKEWANEHKYNDIKFKVTADDFWITFIIKFK